MNTSEPYGKFYAKTFTGSMRGAGAHVIALMAYCVANAKPPDGELEINLDIVSFLIGEPEERMTEALAYLTAPDPRSRSKGDDGRRLVQVGEYRYRLVNWMEHREGRTVEEQRIYWRDKQMEYRKRRKEQKRAAECEGAQEAIRNGLRESGRRDVDADLRSNPGQP